MYEPLWSVQTLKLQYETRMKHNHELQLLEIGDFHTLALTDQSRVYSWGLNDVCQLGRPKKIDQHKGSCQPIKFPTSNFRPKQIAAGDEHNLLLEGLSNSLYVWGSNLKGQHGLGHTNDVPQINVIDFDSSDPITDIRAKGARSLVITDSGAVYIWPYEKSNGEMMYSPVELTLPPKILIATAACGYDFTILVAKSGLIFSFGKDNSAGQLGLGDRIPRKSPSIIKTFQNSEEKAIQVSCGFRHVICLTFLGKVYTWGSGQANQLGSANTNDELEPVSVFLGARNFKDKAVQVQAGFRHSMILLETRKVLWAGTNGSVSHTQEFVEVDMSQKIPDYKGSIDIIPVKIMCSWSRSMSVSNITLADLRTVEIGPQAKTKLVSTLVSNIEDNRAWANLDLPSVRSISKYFDRRSMVFAPEKTKTGVRIKDKEKEKEESPHPKVTQEQSQTKKPSSFENSNIDEGSSLKALDDPTHESIKDSNLLFNAGKGLKYIDIYNQVISSSKRTLDTLKLVSSKASSEKKKNINHNSQKPKVENSFSRLLYASYKKETPLQTSESDKSYYKTFGVKFPLFNSFGDLSSSRYSSPKKQEYSPSINFNPNVSYQSTNSDRKFGSPQSTQRKIKLYPAL